MKVNQNIQRHNQKPIKYKQFIQQLQNSSRSSIHDQSMLSQRSFRQSNTVRQYRQLGRNDKNQKSITKGHKLVDDIQKNSYKISEPRNDTNKINQIQQKNDKLYTFCDAKIGQKSIQITKQNQLAQLNVLKQLHNGKYAQDRWQFKTDKPKSEQKQNMNFVNQIIQKVQTGGFQGKALKPETDTLDNLKSNNNSPQPTTTPDIIKSTTTNNITTSHRKTQINNKIFLMSKQSQNKKTINRSRNVSNSDQKSRQSSLNKNYQQNNKKNGVVSQECSSRKKIISLNINPLKAQNKVRLKLSFEKSYQNNHLSIESHALASSLQKMPSLQQSKIQSLHNENSNANLLLSGAQLKQLNSFFTKQKSQIQKQDQKSKLMKIIGDMRQKQRKLRIEVTQLSQKLKQGANRMQDGRQVQILRRDCSRLNNSYRQIKKLYEMTVREKQETQAHMQIIVCQNSDLKECLRFKKQEVVGLQNQLGQFQQQICHLEQQLSMSKFPSQLSGLSELIKQKIGRYEAQISYLVDQNQKLTLLRQKLQNYSSTLKDEIQQKDKLIWQLQKQQEQLNQMRRSWKEQVLGHRQSEMRLNKMAKQLQNKVKLTNIHNQYLTKQLVCLKHQRKRNSPHEGSPPVPVKFGSVNTLANTITTRNSSISHGKQKFDTLMNNHHQRTIQTGYLQ